jgi:transglutaminase-like putative cysteine protease
MLLDVRHETTYRYAEKVTRSTQYIRLTPFAGPRQRVIGWQVELPGPSVTMRDAFDNETHLLTLDSPHSMIQLIARGRVEVDELDHGEPAGRINPMVFLRTTRLTAVDDPLRAFVEPMRRIVAQRPLIGVTDLMAAVAERMPYQPGSTLVGHTAAESFALGAGVCQDHTHVFLACCRYLAIPARYVSGYVHASSGAQVASHAWAEAWIAQRWVSFDISNARHAGGGHIKLAIGLDYLDACPVRGVRIGGGEESLSALASVEIAQQ